jgi:hypothetical protein
MIPVYAVASLLSFFFYWHAIYFHVISACYEAFAISSFFALLCHYVAPTLHEQKDYFRRLQPIRPWIFPLSWMQCFGGPQKGPLRTPRSGLTWFNLIWIGIYQYCFVRVAMTITSVVTQYFDKYCESSDSPVFAHVWVGGLVVHVLADAGQVLVIEGVAVTIAMYFVVQFYVQLRQDLAHHRPFLKVLAIKLVIFLSFWQALVISLLSGPTFHVIRANETLAYPDIAVGLPALLVCVEMAIFSVLHIFAYPWSPYTARGATALNAKTSTYDGFNSAHDLAPNQGGTFGIAAMIDAMNPIDIIRAFARGVRWLFVGFKHRQSDVSYKLDAHADQTFPLQTTLSDTAYTGVGSEHQNRTLPIANQFRRSRFDMGKAHHASEADEVAALMQNAQPNPKTPATARDTRQQYYNGEAAVPPYTAQPDVYEDQDIGMAHAGHDRGTPTPGASQDATRQAHGMLWSRQGKPGAAGSQMYAEH